MSNREPDTPPHECGGFCCRSTSLHLSGKEPRWRPTELRADALWPSYKSGLRKQRFLFRAFLVLSHGSRPYPSVIGFPRLRERSRFSCPGAIALRSYGALLVQVYQKSTRTSSGAAWEIGRAGEGLPFHPYPKQGTMFHPPGESRGHSNLGLCYHAEGTVVP